MFTGLTEPLRMGETVAGTLTFEKAGVLKSSFEYQAMGATTPTESNPIRRQICVS